MKFRNIWSVGWCKLPYKLSVTMISIFPEKERNEFRTFYDLFLDLIRPLRSQYRPKTGTIKFPGRATRALDAWGKLSHVIPWRSASRYFWRSPELTHFLCFSLVLSRAPPRDARSRKDRGGVSTFVRRSRSADCKSAVASPKNRGHDNGKTPILRMQCRRSVDRQWIALIRLILIIESNSAK